MFQSFPCLRVLRPGEFSIGPHCDAQYNLPDGNLNVWLPLTDAFNTNSLYLERRPGAEDFHPLNLSYGEYVTFYGQQCVHFAVENLTQDTRVSLDFRVVPGCCYDEGAASGLAMGGKPALGSYYSACQRNVGEGKGKFTVTVRGGAGFRHGFPHTNDAAPATDPQTKQSSASDIKSLASDPDPPALCDVAAVRTFNPWVEACVARGSVTANPPARVQILQSDLACLPLWFEPRSHRGGAVLLRQGTAPGTAFLEDLAALGIGVPTPVFVSYEKGRSNIELDDERSTLPLLPWGWSPHTQELYSRLRTERKVWYTGHEEQRQLFGKAWAAGLLKRVLARHLAETEPENRCCVLPGTETEARYQRGEACRTIDEVCDAIEALCQAGGNSKRGVVIKDSFEGSGRGFIHVKPWALQSAAAATRNQNRELTLLRPEQLGAVRKILKRCPVVVERWLPMVTEISAHFIVSDTDTETTVGFRGCLRFSASGLGKWVGSHARDPCCNMEPRVREALFADPVHRCYADTPLPMLRSEIRDAFERVRLELKEALQGSGYCGPLSVDAILYETEEAEEHEPRLMLKPISEINLRENMGTLVLHLSQYVHASKAGFYTILSASYLAQLAVDAGETPTAEGFSLARHAAKLREDYPLQLTHSSAAYPQITSGVLCLTPPGVEFMAVLVVADSTEQARAIVRV